MQKVIIVESDTIINDLENNAVIFNKENGTYFKKKPEIILVESLTFRDAVMNVYKDFARICDRETNSLFFKYSDSYNPEKILENYQMIDKLTEIDNLKIERFDKQLIYTSKKDNLTLKSYTFTTGYLNKFSKLIYVDQINGNDMNDGNIDFPVKSIRRAESLIIDNTAIIMNPGVYDITKGNKNSNSSFCVSGLSGKKINNKPLYVEYLNLNNVDDVLFIVYGDNSSEVRDISFMNGFYKGKIKNISFKMIDTTKSSPYAITIARLSDNIEIENCVFEINARNANIIYSTIQDVTVKFINCFIYVTKELYDTFNNKVYVGKYELENCYINKQFYDKIISFDANETNMLNQISLVSQLNTTII